MTNENNQNKNEEVAHYEQEVPNNYMYLYTGNKFYPAEPKSEDINVLDIAHALSRLVRYTGHIEKAYTVGEHSIGCCKVARNEGFGKRIQLIALFHDATEAVVGDLNRIVKQYVPEYKAIEDNVAIAIWDMLGIEYPTTEEYEIVKQLDNCLLLNEINQLTTDRDDDFSKLDFIEAYYDVSKDISMDQVKLDFLKLYYQLIKDVA